MTEALMDYLLLGKKVLFVIQVFAGMFSKFKKKIDNYNINRCFFFKDMKF